MGLSVTMAPGKPAVAVVGLSGDLDASNYLQAIQRVDELYKGGARGLVLDLTATQFISSSGLVAIHSMALIMQGVRPPNPEDGWSAIHARDRAGGNKGRESLKLVNPTPRVAGTLAKVGFSEEFEIYPTVDAAVATL